jgi:ATP adenylyltransferase
MIFPDFRMGFMEAIYAPWRSEYIRGKKPGGCIFCKDSLRNDDFVLYEGKTSFVMMNRYPYSCGHLLIIPFRHLSQLHDLSPDERLEMFNLMDISVRVLKETMKPDGCNIGMNLGKVAGAGIDDHLHAHIVPRWNGDTNFMTVVGETRVISEDLTNTRNHIISYFERISRQEA